MESFDSEFLVAGAGPAGLTVARLLALKGRPVIVIDPGPGPASRLELLSPASLGTVTALGLAPLLEDSAIARPCLGIRRCWNSDQPEYEDFLGHPRRTGYVVDRAAFDGRLRASAEAAGVEFRRARVTGVEPDQGGVRITANDGRCEAVAVTGVLIDATGRAAVVARRKGARVAVRDRMVAELMEEAITETATNAPAWLDFQTQGSSWSYQIRGPGGRAQTWRIRRSGTKEGPHAMSRVDASAGILSEAAGAGWIAIGDAAIAFDPIASQGLYNALSSALTATGALVSADGLNAAACRLYSDAVAATFFWSEAGRAEVYGAAIA